MDAVLKPLVLYIFLLIIFSIAGKRSLGEMDTFDLVLLLVLSEAAENALMGENYSFVNAVVVILTLVVCEIVVSWIKSRYPRFEIALQGGPLILVEDGKMLKPRMRRALIDEADILISARQTQGLERLDQIKYAVLETSGKISIIPKS